MGCVNHFSAPAYILELAPKFLHSVKLIFVVLFGRASTADQHKMAIMDIKLLESAERVQISAKAIHTKSFVTSNDRRICVFMFLRYSSPVYMNIPYLPYP